MKHSWILLLIAFELLLQNFECSQVESPPSPDMTCNKYHCEQCMDSHSQLMCKKLETCATISSSTSRMCKRINEVQEEMNSFCDSCESTREQCEGSLASCAGRKELFPAFPIQCVQENQPCSKGVYKSCCKPHKCEKDASGKRYVCSSKKAPPKPPPTIPNTPAPIITTVSSHVHNHRPDQQVTTPGGCTDDEITGTYKPLTPKPPSTTPAKPSKHEGLCKAPENSEPFSSPYPEPNCSNCTYEDPVCCDGQYCDLEESLCKPCSAGLKDECLSRPQNGSDCCISSLACLISERGAENGTCEATQCASHGRYVCDSDYNCCRENMNKGPTRFECRYSEKIDGEETYYCKKCAKPGECCRSSKDCCLSPLGYACFNNICDFSREEFSENSTSPGLPEE